MYILNLRNIPNVALATNQIKITKFKRIVHPKI